MVYVDETGIDVFLHREYGRSPRGEAVMGETSGKKFKRLNIVAGRCGETVYAPFEYQGFTDSILFEAWFAELFLPAIPAGSVIVMDNAAFHRKKHLLKMLEGSGHELIFLPAYSPDLNPIEHFWAWLKRMIRKVLCNFNSLSDALSACFQS
jgi:transposase